MEGRTASCLRIPGSTEGHPRLEPLYLLLWSQLTWWSGAGKGEEASVNGGVEMGAEV